MARFLPRLLVAAAAACLASVVSGEHVQYQIRRGEIASRATNLGGWLCAEYWMASSSPLYKDVPSSVGLDGEFAVMTLLGKEKGTKQFEQHWKTFITEEDVAKVAKTGMNTVRVSTGFWIINDEDETDQSTLTNTYAKGALKYLDKLVNEWGVKYNLAVMVSLHAHRGSQNGMDHSAPAVKGKTMWSDDPANVASSLNYATFIANRYRNSPAFLGLNLMNEPNRPTNYDILKKYYKDAYAAIRADGNDCVIVTSPWLENQGPPAMDDFMTCPEYYNVWHEWHIYYKWGWESVSKADVFKSAATYAANKLKPWKGNPMYIGEWSLATIDEIELTPDELTRFWETQVNEYEQAGAGWAFWAWRHDEETNKTSGWSQRQLIKDGIISIPTTELKRTPNPLCKVITTRGNDTLPLLSSSSGSGSGSQDAIVVPSGTTTQPEQKQSTVAPSPPPAFKSAATSGSLETAFLAVASAALAWTAL